ncbi:MAG: ComF family protein [Oscillospiraceae bacterium]|nr:ComF family protein [Oscillospiraceae bacterium]
MKLQQDPFKDDFDVLTWVPVSSLRRLTRGYDQAELIARALGQELGMTPVPGIIKKRHTKPQSGIHDREMRRANVFNAYEGINPSQFAGKRVLLVDDVVTTGSTAAECAKTLLVSGATHVYLVALAATPNHKSRR